MKKVLILSFMAFSVHAEQKAGSKVYIDIGLGMTNMSGNVSAYSQAGSYTAPNTRTSEFYTYKLASLKKGADSSAFKVNSSFNVGWDKEIAGRPLMVGVFVGGGVGQGLFQPHYDAVLGQNIALTGTSTLTTLTLNVNTLTASNVAQSVLNSVTANNGQITSSTTPFANMRPAVRNLTGNGGVLGNITNGGAGTIDTVNNTVFATLPPPVADDILVGNGSPMGTIGPLTSDINTQPQTNVAQAVLAPAGGSVPANNGIATVNMVSSRASTQTEKVFMTFREKGRFQGGFRIGVPTGLCFPHLILGYTMHFISSEINRKNSDTLETEKFSVSKAVSALSVGCGVDCNVSKSFIMGVVFNCSFGKKTRFDFSKKNMTWAPGQINTKVGVRFAPTIMNIVFTAKYAFPINR